MTQDLPSNSREGANKVPQRPGDATLLVAHLDAAYNMARYLMRNETEAEDVVQSAYVRAISHFAGFRGGDHAPLVDPTNTLSVNSGTSGTVPGKATVIQVLSTLRSNTLPRRNSRSLAGVYGFRRGGTPR